MSSKIYTLGYTGPEVDQAIEKINNLDITSLSGGIIELESTEATPYNLDFLRVVGLYKAAYVYDLTAPSNVANISPVYIYVSKVNDGSESGKLVQSLQAGDATYTRVSMDAGQTWEVWESSDGLNSAVEITREDVDAIFAEVFGSENISTAAAFSLLTANSRVAANASTAAAKPATSATSRKGLAC